MTNARTTDLRSSRQALALAGTFGLLGVAFGAFGAHGLEGKLSAEQLEWWNTAARYQQIHAVALLAVAGMAGPWTRARQAAVMLLSGGIVVFAGTLDLMALGGPRWLGAITPLGGLGLIGGWACVIAHALMQPRASAG